MSKPITATELQKIIDEGNEHIYEVLGPEFEKAHEELIKSILDVLRLK